jgi:hypothetical protein
MSTAKTFFEWCVSYFSGYCIIKEIVRAYFSSFFLNNFLGFGGNIVFHQGYPSDSRIPFLAQRALRNGTQREYPRVVFLLHFLSAYFLSALCAKIES